MYLTMGPHFTRRKQHRHCHSERSGAESKNLKCLSLRKANKESSYAVFTLGHDVTMVWISGLAVMDFGFLAALGITMALWRPYKEMKMGWRRGRATTRVAPTTGLPEAIFIAIAHVGCHRHHQS